MQPRSTSPDPSLPSRSRRPRAAVLVERHGSDAVSRCLAALEPIFRCTVYDAEQTVGSELLDDPDLVIWELGSVGAGRNREAFARSLLGASPGRPVLVITDRVDAATFHRISDHVTEFVVHPFTCEELVLRARRVVGLHDADANASAGPSDRRLDANIVGHSALLLREVDRLRRYAACNAGVLILGETGTGKEVFAQAVHYLSARADKPMVAINCGAVPAELMEAELFGHVRGAYTNAHASRAGLVSEAQGGTLFLDDVDCLGAAAQAKLLRFLQEREYRVVGSNDVRHADVRVVAASNRDLAELARNGGFRHDLYYRLNVLTLSLPPLREHREDIAALADHFLRDVGRRHKRPGRHLTPGALLKLLGHDWPGNVRELGHVLERAVLLSTDVALAAVDIDLPDAGRAVPNESFKALKARVVDSFERSYIENLLSTSGGNIADAARAAGKNRRALFELIRKHEISPASFRIAARS